MTICDSHNKKTYPINFIVNTFCIASIEFYSTSLVQRLLDLPPKAINACNCLYNEHYRHRKIIIAFLQPSAANVMFALYWILYNIDDERFYRTIWILLLLLLWSDAVFSSIFLISCLVVPLFSILEVRTRCLADNGRLLITESAQYYRNTHMFWYFVRYTERRWTETKLSRAFIYTYDSDIHE